MAAVKRPCLNPLQNLTSFFLSGGYMVPNPWSLPSSKWPSKVKPVDSEWTFPRPWNLPVGTKWPADRQLQ